MVSHYVIMKSSVIHPRSDSQNWPRSSECGESQQVNFSCLLLEGTYRNNVDITYGFSVHRGVHESPVKQICVLEHSVMTNFNCACPAIQRGQGSGFLSEGSSWYTACILKQVAQRATIAHLSPMCQSQISFQKTYKWAMETRGPKSNSSELLCLSWLPATLMTIWSKMNELACTHHFPILSLWEIFKTLKGS